MACKWVCFAYRFLPLTAWRAFLLDRHIDHCPSCQDTALGDAAIRSLGMTPAGLENEPPLSPVAAGSRALSRGAAFRFRWSYATGVFLVGAVLWAAIALWRIVPPALGPRGTVTVAETDDEACVFAVLEARVGDTLARPVIFKPGQPGMTIVWFEKASN
jgi:hypothetical protein